MCIGMKVLCEEFGLVEVDELDGLLEIGYQILAFGTFSMGKE